MLQPCPLLAKADMRPRGRWSGFGPKAEVGPDARSCPISQSPGARVSSTGRMHVLAEAAIERPGRDLPDARVRADMTGRQIFSVRADVRTMAEIEERAEVMHA